MQAFSRAILILAAVVLASVNRYGIGSVLLICAVVAAHMSWLRLRTEILIYMAGMPHHLKRSIFLGLPLGVTVRTLVLAAILVPVYILCP